MKGQMFWATALMIVVVALVACAPAPANAGQGFFKATFNIKLSPPPDNPSKATGTLQVSEIYSLGGYDSFDIHFTVKGLAANTTYTLLAATYGDWVPPYAQLTVFTTDSRGNASGNTTWGGSLRGPWEVCVGDVSSEVDSVCVLEGQ